MVRIWYLYDLNKNKSLNKIKQIFTVVLNDMILNISCFLYIFSWKKNLSMLPVSKG